MTTVLPNPEQQKAILHTQGPLLILAGAGSGKTRVLTLRIVHLIKQGVPANAILAVTFTNKAAKEMENRVQSLLSVEKKPWISTFHAYTVRVLRQECEILGFRPNFSIYSTTDQLSLYKQILKKRKLDDTHQAEEALREISLTKSIPLSPEAFIHQVPDRPEIALIYQDYQESLKAFNALDFDDLLCHTLTLFQNYPEILQKYQREFQYILIDEYQDTNPVQFELVSLLARPHRNLCVVGDDDQGIYSFRGARSDNLSLFQKNYPEARLIKLEQNYRSSNQILKAANLLIQGNSNRIEKKLWSKNPDGPPLHLIEAHDEREEATRVCSHLIQQKTLHRKPFDHYAILFRTNAQTRLFEEELRRNQIPYQVIGGTKFYDRREIRDILSYLSVLFNPRDEVSLFRIINVPARGIGTTSLQKLNAICLRSKQGVFQVLKTIEFYSEIPALAQKGMRDFVELLLDCQQEIHSKGLVEMTTNLIEKIHYKEELYQSCKDAPEAERRYDNVLELLNGMAYFLKTTDDPSLANYLKSVALYLEEPESATATKAQEGKVTLITLHACKGLEFPSVYMVGLEEELLPHFRSLTPQDIAEERRLCYVGITRAMHSLTLSYAKKRQQRNRTSQQRFRSRFLDEIEKELKQATPALNASEKQALIEDSLAKMRAILFKTEEKR
jgi:DNA helicase-2/ATP-dependent DNA helicase PcrA